MKTKHRKTTIHIYPQERLPALFGQLLGIANALAILNLNLKSIGKRAIF